MTLETADLLAIAGIVFGSMLAVVGGALAWLRADIAKLDDRQRATDAKVDSLTQTLLATALARNPLVPPPDPQTPPSARESEPLKTGPPQSHLASRSREHGLIDMPLIASPGGSRR